MLSKVDIRTLEIEQMLNQSKVVSGVLEVVYNLVEIESYTKKDAAQDLINFLSVNGFLEEIKHYKGDE